ncbi:hypothetical protein TNCV_3696811 [Trichonephila clavipes]|uniref:Uncharacterized protein n=1 Tax=Trichonephila clavipes TaxID=2585209 RepID=A0A8X6SA57_TRICX|nr:hypothetical protein TNCV_3696811 [Trichonephila clavipes]
MDFTLLKNALTNSFPVVRNISELEAEFYAFTQAMGQSPSDFVYRLSKVHKMLHLVRTEEGLINNIVLRSPPLVVEVRNPTTKTRLLQLLAKYEERHVWAYT